MKRKMNGQGEIIRYSKLKERKEKKAMPVYNRIPWHCTDSIAVTFNVIPEALGYARPQ